MAKIYNTKKGVVKVIRRAGRVITFLPPYFSGTDLKNLKSHLKTF